MSYEVRGASGQPVIINGYGIDWAAPADDEAIVDWDILGPQVLFTGGTYAGQIFAIDTALAPSLGLISITGGSFTGCYFGVKSTTVISGGTFAGGEIYPSTAQVTITGGTWSGIWSLGLTPAGTWGNFSDAVSTITFAGSGLTYVAATATPTISGGAVTALTVTSGGAGYTAAPYVAISGGGGSGATAVASISAGAVNSITVTNEGSGYTAAPTVTLSGTIAGTLADGSTIDIVLNLDTSNGLNTHVVSATSTSIVLSG